jgi:phytoene synthase
MEKGRIYIPLDEAAAHGISEKDILERHFDDRYISLMKSLISRTRALFAEGAPLSKMVDARLKVDLELFSKGGVAVLDAIEEMGYDTLHRRPSISKTKQVRLLGRALVTRAVATNRKPEDLQNSIAVNSLADSYQECQRIIKAAHSNFYYAFFLLPKPKRDALTALYAFMRLVDDVADEGDNVADKQRGLAKWRAAFDRALTQRPDAPLDEEPNGVSVLPALVDTMQRYSMPSRYLHDLISGAEMDLTVHTYPTFERLKEYCYRVAGTVGLTCTHVFGFRDSRALDLAEKLGLAFQLTNIIRDVHEDYKLGRMYLPEEDLARYGISPSSFGLREATLGVRELLRFEAERAWQLYKQGAELLNLIDEDSRGTLWLLAHTYSALLARIESQDFAVFGERVRLSRAEKMVFIAKARFGRLTEENIIEKRDRDRRWPGGTGVRRRVS